MMLKLISQFWLILSLLVAPLPYATADIALAGQTQEHCENHVKSNQDTQAQEDSCECCEQCGVVCATTCFNLSVGLSQLNSFIPSVQYNFYHNTVLDTAIGIASVTEFRPPRKLHA